MSDDGTKTQRSGLAIARKNNHRIPLSLGKASLRIRLEAYYSLIAPETLLDRNLWLRKYDQIYDKYGGSHQGERKLASKLAKKYGTTVRLLVVSEQGPNADLTRAVKTSEKREESWYKLRPNESRSGVVDFLSINFDPEEALNDASEADIQGANPWMEKMFPKTILDNIGKCSALLPIEDPLRKDAHRKVNTADDVSTVPDSNKRPRTNKTHREDHPFDAIVSNLDNSGPHSVLIRLRNERKRAKVVVRYVNMLRGTITGRLLAFDKHMNLILQDVEEVYTPRIPNGDNQKSNLELEWERRHNIRDEIGSNAQVAEISDESDLTWAPGRWKVRRRQMKQILVRGDMVVAIYDAASENTAVQKSRYRKRMQAPK